MKEMQTTQHHRFGFTLIEMMIVIFIIALLAALTLGISSSVMRNAEKHKTEDILKLMTMALEEWELEQGRSMTFDGHISVVGGRYDILLGGIDGITEPTFSEQGVQDEDMLQAMRIRMVELVLVLRQSESSSEVLSKITPDHFCKTSGTAPDEIHTSKLCNINGPHPTVIVDSWGTPVGIVFPGRNYFEAYPNGNPDFDPSFDESGDRTVLDQAEDGLGSCMNERPYFVSAGPDQKWGYRFQSNDQNAGPGIETPPDSGIYLWEDSIDNVNSYEPYLVETAR